MTILNICAPSFDPADSYGRIASELATYLSAQAHVNRLALDGSGNGVISPAMGGILLGYPTLHQQFGGMVNAGPKIAITMFESTVLPEGWAEALNKCDAVIVPATFLVDIFKKAGVTTPIYVVPLGVSAEFMRYTQRVNAEFMHYPQWGKKTGEPFTFLTIGDRGIRKGWMEACTAFVRAFGNDMNYRLIIKARNPFPFGIDNPNIEVITGDMTNAELAELYTRAHVMVFPTRGEGYGLPPREFVATGGLALVTNWGGTAEDIDSWAIPIPCTMETAWLGDDKWYGKLGEWARPDVDALAGQMNFVQSLYESFEPFREMSADYIQQQTWDVFSHRVFAIWRTVLEGRYGRNRNRDSQSA
ncbi:MAG: hypothetical protein KJ043_22950 [Anaerolineae bacterium]|nr:hypothetical protein [Anaerolineae bacterium]